ncbi:unnamed protein product [Bemisia tabaci]|uniref:CCHC-type domain-containing protein n=1 Tax=Bemisia tabaci TaxID=7038 RepID=A0A9P0ADQ5_BEMTA|nr:unnamed protein product [Bemisia tabaci]
MDSHKTRNKASRRRGGKKKFENKAVTKTPSKKEEAKKFSPLAAQRLNELTNLFSKVGSNNVYGVVVLIRWNSFQTIPIRSQDALYNNKYECSLDYGSFIPEVDKYELNGMLNQMQKFPSMDQVELKEKEYERALFWLRAFAKRPIGVVLLDLQKIIRLEKVKEHNPLAQFFCNVCNYCCNSLEVVVHHIADERHKKKLEVAREKISMKYLASAAIPDDHCLFYSEALETHFKQIMMSEKNIKLRSKVQEDISKIIQKFYPSKGFEVRLIGSSAHGMGLESAEVNLDLSLPTDTKISQVFLDISEHMKASHFSAVSIDHDADFLLLTSIHNSSKLKCTMSVNHTKAFKLALLLTEYKKIDPVVTKLAVLFRHWGQLTSTDDPKHGTLPGYAFYLLVVYFLQQKGFLPILSEKPSLTGADSEGTCKFEKVGDWQKPKELDNPAILFTMWRELFKFYLVDFEMAKHVVAISSQKPVLKETYKWGGKKLSILDPFSLRNIVARTVYHEACHNYILGCMISTLVYYSIPVTKQGPIFSYINEDFDACAFDCFYSVVDRYKKIQRCLVDQILKCDLNYQENKDKENSVQEPSGEIIEPPECLFEWQDYLMEAPIPLFKSLPPRNAYIKLAVTKVQAELMIKALKQDALSFSFCREVFVNCKEVPVYCAGCQQEGHYRDKCPDEYLPPMGHVPPAKPDALEKLTKVCKAVQKKVQLSQNDLFMREKVLKELEGYINERFPEAKLHLFGSSANGLGLKNSDLDICLLLNNDEVLKSMAVADFFNQLCSVLKASKSVYNVVPISTAKIPILKFVHRASRLKGDISCSNLLALENTKLLKSYCSIDDRVSIMCQMMKYLMKSCNVCDASRGSLSSYAYSLMVIYFLQQCSPPVIPVLQELPPPNQKTSIDGFEVSYYKDIPNIAKVWPQLGANSKSCSELWLDLLEFYTERFDFNHHVIAVRQTKILTKLEKLWFSSITIEDPFEQTHNLGSALSKKMSVYIRSIFQKARLLFSMPPSISSNASPELLVDHYFKHRSLVTNGPPIGERACRHCGVIKHLMRDCPELKGKKDLEQNGAINETTALDVDLEGISDSDLNDTGSFTLDGSSLLESRLPSSPKPSPHFVKEEGVAVHVEEFIKKLALNMGGQSPSQSIPPRLESPMQSPRVFFSSTQTLESVPASFQVHADNMNINYSVRSPQVSRNLFPEHIQYSPHGSAASVVGSPMMSPQRPIPPNFSRNANVIGQISNHNVFDPNFRPLPKEEPNGMPLHYEEVKAWNRTLRAEPLSGTPVNDFKAWFQQAQVDQKMKE